jgi:hypothetical protein
MINMFNDFNDIHKQLLENELIEILMEKLQGKVKEEM